MGKPIPTFIFIVFIDFIDDTVYGKLFVNGVKSQRSTYMEIICTIIVQIV